MSTPLDLSTKLKAVNVILAGQGETPIDSLDATQSSLAQKAIEVLEETSRSLQAKGWFWNTEDDFPLNPNADGEVYTPVNSMRVSRPNNGVGDILVVRGQRVYNRTQRTYTFPQGQPITVDMVLYLDWDDVPEFAKQAIIYVAQRRFQMRELTSTAIDRAIEDDLQNAIATLEQAEDAAGPANFLTDSLDGMAREGTIRRRT